MYLDRCNVYMRDLVFMRLLYTFYTPLSAQVVSRARHNLRALKREEVENIYIRLVHLDRFNVFVRDPFVFMRLS